MSSLTEEQRKRIEENRRKALEKRAKSASAAANGVANPASQFRTPSPQISNPSSSLIVGKTSTNSSLSNSTHNNGFYSKPPAANNFFLSNKSASNAAPTNPVTSGIFSVKTQTKYTKGTCILLNRKRFYVDVGFNKELIDLFKTVPSKLYDMQTKKWNFLIEDHDKLIATVKPLQPDILIIPLPPLIINLLKNAPETRRIKEHDLSTLDPVILNALLPFQKDGVNFALQHEGRVLIADDMGLGKTIQAIAIANYYAQDWPLLVVTPSSVRYSWQEAFHTWLPSLAEHEISIINSGKDHIPNNKVVLVSYDMLTKMKDVMIKRKFKTIILDESHFLKNPKSARTKAALEIVKNMKRVIMLSGTPALSKPIELYTQLSSLRPKKFFTYMEYGMRYCNGHQNQWGWDFNGSSNMEELQIFLEEAVMIRRLKSAVIKQLPEKFRQMIILDPNRVHTKSKVLVAMSRQMKEVQLSAMERRGILLQYFHETGDVKLKAICEYVLDLLENDKKFLCFAHHKNVMDGICNAIYEKQKRFIRIDGSVSSEDRKKLCDEFQLNDDCQVAVLSITSANCGITLTAASLVIFAELFWNPGILVQAEDRAHRIGQENSVVVQYLVAKHTADDEMWPLVQRKLDILNKAGLSKDNFRSADTIDREQKVQYELEDFWNDLNESLDLQGGSEVPEKRMKLDF